MTRRTPAEIRNDAEAFRSSPSRAKATARSNINSTKLLIHRGRLQSRRSLRRPPGALGPGAHRSAPAIGDMPFASADGRRQRGVAADHFPHPPTGPDATAVRQRKKRIDSVVDVVVDSVAVGQFPIDLDAAHADPRGTRLGAAVPSQQCALALRHRPPALRGAPGLELRFTCRS
jgi:hypothetical protein